MSEAMVVLELTIWIRENYPDTPYRVDIGADMPLPPIHRGRLKVLHGKWSRGYPDLFIAETTKKHCGLFIEVKTVQAGVADTEHIRRQKAYHEALRKNGYKVEFGVGLDHCKQIIKKYMRKVK